MPAVISKTQLRLGLCIDDWLEAKRYERTRIGPYTLRLNYWFRASSTGGDVRFPSMAIERYIANEHGCTERVRPNKVHRGSDVSGLGEDIIEEDIAVAVFNDAEANSNGGNSRSNNEDKVDSAERLILNRLNALGVRIEEVHFSFGSQVERRMRLSVAELTEELYLFEDRLLWQLHQMMDTREVPVWLDTAAGSVAVAGSKMLEQMAAEYSRVDNDLVAVAAEIKRLEMSLEETVVTVRDKLKK